MKFNYKIYALLSWLPAPLQPATSIQLPLLHWKQMLYSKIWKMPTG